jgi:hypothetical protein
MKKCAYVVTGFPKSEKKKCKGEISREGKNTRLIQKNKSLIL